MEYKWEHGDLREMAWDRPSQVPMHVIEGAKTVTHVIALNQNVSDKTLRTSQVAAVFPSG